MRPVEVLEQKLGRGGLSRDKTIVFCDGEMGNPEAGGTMAFSPVFLLFLSGSWSISDTRTSVFLTEECLLGRLREGTLETTGHKLPPTTFKARL